MARLDPLGSSQVRALITGQRFGYPFGFGAVARVRAYAKGLIESGASVEVVSLLAPDPEGPGVNEKPSGIHDGVPFEYAYGTRTRAGSFRGRRLLEARAPLGLARAARRLFRGRAAAQAIIAYTDHPVWIVFMALLARASGARCIVELCELPFVYEQPGLRRTAKLWLQDAVAYPLVDGFIAISSRLEEYAVEHSGGRAQVIRVPILVAVDEFDTGEEPAARAGREFAYLGDLGHAGEVADLLDAFAPVAAAHEDVRLRLIGDAQPGRREKIEARVAELGLDGQVEFAGAVDRAGLPAALGRATAHVLLRRDSEFSRAGLPTKLAEYLASGRPVIVTAIGDISAYLTDGVDAYLAPPGDAPAFSAQLERVLADPAEARAVGARGRAVAARRFDYRRHGRRLDAFIRSL